MDEPLRRRLEIYVVCTLLIAAVLIAYWNAPYNGFAYDDYGYILANTRIQSGLTLTALAWAFTTDYSGNWHPLTWVSHMIDCGLYAAKPVGHHLTSILLHLANTLLLFALLLAATRAPWRSGFVALLFGVHPLHVESVAWISERKDVLSTFFGLLAMLSYIAYARKSNVRGTHEYASSTLLVPKSALGGQCDASGQEATSKHSRPLYALTLALFVLGLMSKPMLVTLPILLLLMDYWPVERLGDRSGRPPGRPELGRDGTRPLREKAPLFAISVASAVVTLLAQRLGATVPNLNQLPLPARLGNAVVSYVVYVRKTFWPSDLVAFYPHPEGGLPWWEIAGAGALLVAITILVLRRTTPRYLLVGWLWYIITLGPVIGIVQVGGQAMADRYTYIPLIGLFIMLAWGAPDLIRGKRGVAVLTAAAILLTLPLVLATRRQVSYWKDDETLFTHAVKLTRRNWVANHTLGVTLADKREWSRALPYAREAVRIQSYNPASRRLLGKVLTRLNRLDEAVDELDEAIVLEPDSAEAHARLANALRLRGDLEEARKEAEIALDLQPDNATAGAVLEKFGLRQTRH